MSEYLVADVHSQRGYFAYEDELSSYKNTISSQNPSIMPKISVESIRSSEEEPEHYRTLQPNQHSKHKSKPRFASE